MALKLYNEDDIKNIADAIREKGVEGSFKVSDMPAAIAAISGGGSDLTPIVLDGVLSSKNPGGYGTVDFPDNLNDYVSIILKIKTNVNSQDYVAYYSYAVSLLSTSELLFGLTLHTYVSFAMTSSYVKCNNYSGNWEDIYVDIYGVNMNG